MNQARSEERTRKLSFLCGWCAGAPLCANGVAWAHRHCRAPEGKQCACAALDHKMDATLAQRFADYCHVDIDTVYELHGRKRRVLTDEQREAAGERLAVARAVKQSRREEQDANASPAG
jgi:hypothetical protein